MRNEKAEELRRLKIAFNRKVSVERRMKTMGRITSRIISALAKHPRPYRSPLSILFLRFREIDSYGGNWKGR